MKIGKAIFTIALAFALFGCNTATVKNGGGESIQTLKNEANVELEYQPYSALKEGVIKEAEMRMWDQARIDKELNAKPKGGMLTFKITGLTIDAANTKWWEFVVKDNAGTEIKRVKGRNDIPQYSTSKYGTTWWNTAVIFLNEPINGYVDVYVNDTLRLKQSAFRITTAPKSSANK